LAVVLTDINRVEMLICGYFLYLFSTVDSLALDHLISV